MILETHLHTKETSPCGKVPAAYSMAAYKDSGYEGVIVTDHFAGDILASFPGSLEEKLNRYLLGYRTAKAEGDRIGISVFFGMELRLITGPEDILLYGLTPDFVFKYPDLFSLSLKEASEIVHQEGGLLVQAHPFREPCKPLDVRYLDGIEVHNAHPRHPNHNERALEIAEQNPHLIRLSGSDYHQTPDLARSGIITSSPVRNEQEIANILRAGAYQLIISEDTKECD